MGVDVEGIGVGESVEEGVGVTEGSNRAKRCAIRASRGAGLCWPACRLPCSFPGIPALSSSRSCVPRVGATGQSC